MAERVSSRKLELLPKVCMWEGTVVLRDNFGFKDLMGRAPM